MKLHTQIFVAIIAGTLAGIIFKGSVHYVSFLGTIFIRSLLMIIAPLILASMITGVANIGNLTELGRIGLKTLIYYGATTAIAVMIGLTLVNVIQPGVGAQLGTPQVEPALQGPPPTIGKFFSDQTTNILRNPFDALARGNVLSIIFFALLLGGILSTMGQKGTPVIAFFDSLNEAMMKLTGLVMRFAPFGVFALMANVVAETGIRGVVQTLGKYMITVLIGLAIHGLVVLPVLVRLLGRMKVGEFFTGMQSAFMLAFSTSSSSATLPVTMECATRNIGISSRVASFVLPLGATVNMDGTALYEAVAAMFISQAYGIQMGTGEQVIIFVTATLAAVGAAGIPGAGMVTMAIVLKAVGLPLEGIAIILAVDRLLDMCRTTVNVLGDSVGAAVIDSSEKAAA